MHDVQLPAGEGLPTRQISMSVREFIALCASLAAIAATSIDIMLPALPAIGRTFAVEDDNTRQLVILVFAVTFAVCQIFYGPISDRFGRKPTIFAGLLLYLCGCVGALFAGSFEALLAMRVVQGIGAAAMQVVTMALIRDCYSGQAMGRILTFVFTTFMIFPIIAPFIGQGIEFVGGWQAIFIFNALFGTSVLLWVLTRLEETLPVENRRSLAFSSIAEAFWEIVRNRITAGYAIASTISLIPLFGYVVSVQQIYGELYGLGDLFPVAFGASGIGVAIAGLVSARLVRSLGIRTVAHGSMLIYTFSGMALLLLSLVGHPPFWVTFVFLSISMMTFGVMQGNFSALALEPLGHVAGMASSLYGVLTTTAGTFFGGLIGQAYNGTVIPLASSFGIGGLFITLTIFWTTRGRLFLK